VCLSAQRITGKCVRLGKGKYHESGVCGRGSAAVRFLARAQRSCIAGEGYCCQKSCPDPSQRRAGARTRFAKAKSSCTVCGATCFLSSGSAIFCHSVAFAVAVEAGSGGRGDNCETFGNGRTEGRLNYFHLTRNEIRHKHKRFATMVGHTGGGSQQAIQSAWQMGGETAKATNFQRLADLPRTRPIRRMESRLERPHRQSPRGSLPAALSCVLPFCLRERLDFAWPG
jgi:hypothetical protein